MKSTTAISRRLIVYLGLTLPVLWLTTALFSAIAVYHEINEAGDTQLSQLARELLQVPVNTAAPTALAQLDLNKKQRGLIDDDEMGFAVWRADGQLLVSDPSGRKITHQGHFQGFLNQGHWWQKHAWRIFYLNDEHSGLRAAVSASRRERLETVLNAVWIQLGLSVLALPLLLWLIVWGVRKGTQPLLRLADELNRRDAHSLAPLDLAVPTETRPMVTAVNTLLQRVNETRQREMRFTADASHELRSPLAALKVHTDVLAMTALDDEQWARVHTMQQSVARTQHLIEQLLILSRLDPVTTPCHTDVIDWQHVSDQALHSVSLMARERHIRLQRILSAPDWAAVLPGLGDETLLTILLRNLIDNAIRYSPAHSSVVLQLQTHSIHISNTGTGVADTDLARLHERFFRPAGQAQTGSGLGLSIADSIATLHGLTISLTNRHDVQGHITGFVAKLMPAAKPATTTH